MMEWVHCNNCFALPESEKSFYLTSCGHIYCSDCELQCARNQCKLCGNQCTTIALSSNMKPDVQIFFSDPDELLRKKIKEVQQVSEFQKNHRIRLITHQRKQLKKFKSVKEQFQKLLKNLKDIDSERKRVSEENKMLKQYITLKRYESPSTRTSGGTKPGHENLKSAKHFEVDNILSKFVDGKLQQRMKVISPPMNGKLGIIPGTPSPSSAFGNLNLSDFSGGQNKKVNVQFTTPSTPGSTGSKYITFTSPMSGLPSPLESPGLQNMVNHKIKQVVHPFSPLD